MLLSDFGRCSVAYCPQQMPKIAANKNNTAKRQQTGLKNTKKIYIRKQNEIVTATGSFNVLQYWAGWGKNLEKWQQQIKRIKMELLQRRGHGGRAAERDATENWIWGPSPGAEIKIKTSSKCN